MNHRRFALSGPPRPAIHRDQLPIRGAVDHQPEATTPVIAVNRGYVEPCCAIEGDGLIIYSVRSAIIGPPSPHVVPE